MAGDRLGALHVGAALLAMSPGAVVFLLEKGTTSHRRLGWLYAVAMAAVNATALLI